MTHENIGPCNKDLHIHRSTIHNRQKVETTEKSTNLERIKKQSKTLEYPLNEIPFSTEGNEILVEDTTWMNLKNIRLSEKNRHKRLHVI